jgi:tRNA dimethylallyltransferase
VQQKTLLVILGPTAVGKTELAIEVAKALNTEIISADSRQFYREMNIGTAKPSALQLQEVKHHFINSLSVTDEYNAGKFEEDALKVLDTILQNNPYALMVGGSGLYINAVCNGFDEMVPSDAEVRANITEKYKSEGIEYLRATLKKLDNAYYAKVDLSNPHRMIRAIEVCMITGIPYSQLRKGRKKERNFTVIKMGINLLREELYRRINNRVDEMMKNGLLEEVKSLIQYKTLNALNTVGYKELFEHLEGKTSLDKAIELIKQHTRNFAKRQITWFRHDKEIIWLNSHNLKNVLEIVNGKAKQHR